MTSRESTSTYFRAASYSGVLLTNSLPVAALDAPVVVAVVVHVALSVVQQPVLALLQGEGAVGALEEVVAGLRVFVALLTVRLRATRLVQHRQTVPCGTP